MLLLHNCLFTYPMHFLFYSFISRLFTQIYNFYLDTDKRPIAKNNNLILPSCRKAGVQTAAELLAEENNLMDYQEEPTSEEELNRPITETPTTSDDETTIAPYQKPAKEPLLTGNQVPDLSDDLPDHVDEDLYDYSYIISYHIISYHIISYHIISYHIISYHIISYHIISYHIISYHIISYHIISYNHYLTLVYRE